MVSKMYVQLEAGLLAEGSINDVFDRKHYKHPIRIHKNIYEALMRIAWTEFLTWIENDTTTDTAITAFLNSVHGMSCDINQTNFA